MKIKISKYYKTGPRKVEVNIEPHDTWSLDRSLAYIILPALLQLKETRHGIPSEFALVGGEDYVDQESFDFYKDTHDEAFAESAKLWDEIVDKMIWAFKEIVTEDYEEKYKHGEPSFDFVKDDSSWTDPKTGIKYPVHTIVNKNKEYWFDTAGCRIHQDRIQEGLLLFGKYYLALWD